MKKKAIASIVMLAVLALAAFSMPMPVSADERVYSAVFMVQGQDAAAMPDLIVSDVNAYHYEGAKTGYAWFNLTNYVNVTVKNNGTADADAFNVSLYADGEFIGEQCISNLSAGSNETLVFKWNPEGEDPLGWTDTVEGAILTHTDTTKTYTLEAVVDEANEVSESNETNNNMTASETVKWNGYMADEPLENYAHDTVRGGMIYTTGDGRYHSGEGEKPGTKYGTYHEVNYDLDIPGEPKLARLYFYHTWSKPGFKAPKVGITLKTPSNDIYDLSMEQSWLDCSTLTGYGTLVWGAYAYDITGYVNESGTYVMNITNLNEPLNSWQGKDGRFAHHYSFAAPAVLVVYENESMPEREYWVNEGADVLMGGYRMGLGLEDCINNATFEGSIDLSRVKNATLGVVSPWGGVWQNVPYFNGIELGGCAWGGAYDVCGYSGPNDVSLDGICMKCLLGNTQVGMNLTDVTDYLNASVNIADQGDDGDNMMPSNAFLVVEYKEEAPPTPFLIYGWVNYSTGEPVLNHNVTITNLNTAEVFTAETNESSNYYQVLTTSGNVSADDVLRFCASNGNITEFNHTVTAEEMNKGGFEQDIVITLIDTYPPGSITNLTNVTGNFWISWTWTNPPDADFNYTIVYLNGTWHTNTSYPFYNATDLDPDTCYEIGTHTVDKVGNVNVTWVNRTARTLPLPIPPKPLDTGKGTYPSIMGTHNGNITPAHSVTVSRMYTYPCAGTGGHSEYVELYNDTFYINATWNGYQGDYHNITFPQQFTLLANHTYNYTIVTGSYPQIIHKQNHTTSDGSLITCKEFIDANDKKYNDWIPAIKLFL